MFVIKTIYIKKDVDDHVFQHTPILYACELTQPNRVAHNNVPYSRINQLIELAALTLPANLRLLKTAVTLKLLNLERDVKCM